jgi:hypothetical protein
VSHGRYGEVATYGAHEKAMGVRVTRAADADVLAIEVHVCALYERSLVLPDLAAGVRAAIRQTAERCGAGPIGQIDVVFDDIRTTSPVE